LGGDEPARAVMGHAGRPRHPGSSRRTGRIEPIRTIRTGC